MNSDIVVAIDYSRILFRTLQQECGIKEAQLSDFLKSTDLDPSQFFEHDAYISWANQHQIIQNALKLSNVKGLGVLAGRSYTLATHGLVGVAATASSTLSESLSMIERFQNTRAQFSQSAYFKTDTHYVLRNNLTVDFDEVGQFLIEALTTSMMLAIDFLIGSRPSNLTIYLACEKPIYSNFLEKNLGAKIHYNAEHSELHIPIEYGALPIASHNDAMLKLAEEQCQTLVEQLNPQQSLSHKVLALLRQSPGNRPTQEQMAVSLNMSSRTLLRRLKDEGTTYQQLIDEEYKRLAQHYLKSSNLTIEAIAACMGYHDLASFRRAFKRWFGIPPSQYQRQPIV